MYIFAIMLVLMTFLNKYEESLSSD